jgi:hypothetical protein
MVLLLDQYGTAFESINTTNYYQYVSISEVNFQYRLKEKQEMKQKIITLLI